MRYLKSSMLNKALTVFLHAYKQTFFFLITEPRIEPNAMAEETDRPDLKPNAPKDL